MAANTRFATGLQALVLLAVEPERLRTSDEVAGKLEINAVVVRRIFSRLHRAGMLISQKGPRGGSRLARSPKQITLADVYAALDGGDLFRAADFSGAQQGKVNAALKRAFAGAEEALRDELARTTLNQLAKRSTKK